MATKFLDASGLKYVISKIKVLLSTKQDKLTFDKTPTANSANPVTSDGIKTALDEKPSTTGTGASGTWAINISGTAARANLGNWVYKNDNRWYQVMFSQDSQFNYDRDEFTYNPSLNTIKAGTFQGKLNGNANTAKKATQDADGKVITTTYAKKTDIPTVPVKGIKVSGATSNLTPDTSGIVAIPAIPTNISAFTNDTGYLTTHQDLSGYETKAEVSAIMAGCTEDAITALWSDT